MNKAPLAAIAATTISLGACGQESQAPEQTVQQLMANQVQPTAALYWNSVQFVSDETGDHDIKPETDEGWKRTRDAATKLGELGELLRSPGYAEGRGEDWVTFSNSLIEVSKLAEQAADAKDPDKVFEVGGTIYNVCSACHQAYPATTGPEAEDAAATG